MSAPETETVHVFISGRVQGVWFRGWTEKQARILGLSGWVRNLADGRVEAVFSGPPASVQSMLEKCHRGPIAAKVTSVDVSSVPTVERMTTFEILRSGQ